MWKGHQGIHRHEFYESYEPPLELEQLRRTVREWECICNFLRPSRPLEGKILWKYLVENHKQIVSFNPKLSNKYWA